MYIANCCFIGTELNRWMAECILLILQHMIHTDNDVADIYLTVNESECI